MRAPSRRRRLLATASLLPALGLLPPPRAVAAAYKGPGLTMLSAMAGQDVEQSFERHARLGLRWLDLKDGLYGQSINKLTLDDARRLAEAARRHGLRVWSLSGALGASDLAEGEAAFRARHDALLAQLLALAPILQPRSIRMIAPSLTPYPGAARALETVEREHGWVFGAYARMARAIAGAGCVPLIENETGPTIFARPEGIVRFFERLDTPAARLTWDVQNLWEAGSFPSLDTYRLLRPWIGCIHLKGGRSVGGGAELVHASALEDASWPVLPIVRAACAEPATLMFSLNPSHGAKPPGFDMWEVAQRDVAFLRRALPQSLIT